jgi:nucleoside-diphosphate-sugar epimerase
MKKALVLGGTGAIGVYLVQELLKKGFTVDVTTRRGGRNGLRINYIIGDAKDDDFLKSVLEKTNYDTIVDFMIYSTEEFQSRLDILLGSTKHYIFTSTYRVFADSKVITEESPQLVNVSDDKEYLKTDEYALAKARQEEILQKSKSRNWTIIRPSITYSKNRFQLGVLEADVVVRRALSGKLVPFPIEMLDKKTTMTWAGDVARMITEIIEGDAPRGQSYNVVTSESKTWREVIKYYQKVIGLKVKLVKLSDFLSVYPNQYQVLYDRMFDRVMDNSKILSITGINQTQLIKLEDGIANELRVFLKNPRYSTTNEELDRKIDLLVEGHLKKVVSKVKPRSRFRALKNTLRLRSRAVEIKRKIRIRTRARNCAVKIKNSRKDGLIVTLTGNHNYGGIMQRYALKEFLDKNGFKFDTVTTPAGDRWPTGGNMICMDKFLDEHLPSKKYEPEKLQGYRNYIVGSDQVFRDWYEGNWQEFSMFFLEFVKSKRANKISYAASFGVDSLEAAGIDDNNRTQIGRLLKDFNRISVRERSGAELIHELLGQESRPVDIVLDPTLLLESEDYSRLIEASSEVNGPNDQLFCYILDEDLEKQKIIDKYTSDYGGVCKIINPSLERPYDSVEQWLKGFRDAELVITDSFHGVVFSIINNTDFIVFGNETRGSARIIDLLDLLEISKDRLIMAEADADAVPATINWKKVNKRIALLRRASSNWLIESLKSR